MASLKLLKDTSKTIFYPASDTLDKTFKDSIGINSLGVSKLGLMTNISSLSQIKDLLQLLNSKIDSLRSTSLRKDNLLQLKDWILNDKNQYESPKRLISRESEYDPSFKVSDNILQLIKSNKTQINSGIPSLSVLENKSEESSVSNFVPRLVDRIKEVYNNDNSKVTENKILEQQIVQNDSLKSIKEKYLKEDHDVTHIKSESTFDMSKLLEIIKWVAIIGGTSKLVTDLTNGDLGKAAGDAAVAGGGVAAGALNGDWSAGDVIGGVGGLTAIGGTVTKGVKWVGKKVLPKILPVAGSILTRANVLAATATLATGDSRREDVSEPPVVASPEEDKKYLESMETAPGMQQAWSKLGIEREKALALAYPQDVTRILGKKEFKSWKESTDKKEVSVTNTNTTVINQYNERTSSTR